MNASAQTDKSQEKEGGCSADEGDDGGGGVVDSQ